MRICILATESSCACSATTIVTRNANAFAEKGHEVVVVFPWMAGLLTDLSPNVATKSLPTWLGKWMPFAGFNPIETIYRTFLVLFQKYDIVFSYTGHRPTACVPSYCARWIRGSVIVTEWWEWFGKGGYAELRRGLARLAGIYDVVCEKRVLSKYDGVVAISQGLADRLPESTNVVVLNGASDSQLGICDRREARRELDLPAEAVIFGMSGCASNDEDDCMPFYEAYLAMERERPELYLLASGNPEYLECLRNKMGFARFIGIGWPAYVLYSKYMSACDAYVLPYPPTNRNNGRWPNKFGDFMWLGRPVITNPTGDVKKYLEEHRVGYVCGNNKGEYVKLLDSLLSSGALQRYDSGEFEEVSNRLSFRSRTDALLEYFTDIIQSKR